ncbi:MAG: phosphomethylpyrimidine synthase ThiC [Thermoleophilia bacterium]|nr:phosphomethylpyrimidine synthase ThiC [Thermoleophilia bacterium]
MNQMQAAREGLITPALQAAAHSEGVDPEELRCQVASGRVVLLCNKSRQNRPPLAIGESCRVKVNANLGTSPERADLETELEKLRLAQEAGADSVMDLSTHGDLDSIRRAILDASAVPVGTVPIYQAAVETVRRGRAVPEMDPEVLFATIEKHAADGVDFVTVHCGVTRASVERLQRQGRLTDIVSRGGAFLFEWMLLNEKENPLYEHFDRLLEIAERYDLTLSLGDGLRPGAVADATDRGQIQELLIIGELAAAARARGVQVMIEGPGHVPLDQIEANVLLEKQVCEGAPFYVLGPLVTDVAPGYDHITSAIGGALAAWYGADFLCAVSPAEHLGLPSPDDVRLGVLATRIAAHAGEVARRRPAAWERDQAMSKRRKLLDWEGQAALALDPEPLRVWRSNRPADDGVCSMCGEFCAMKVVSESLREHAGIRV